MHIIYNIDLAGHSRLIVKFSLQLDWSSWPVLTLMVSILGLILSMDEIQTKNYAA